MIKGLEALRFATRDFSSGRDENGNYSTKKDFDLDIIEKSLKALEVIKSKCEFGKTASLNGYETFYDVIVSGLTTEEYDLLKEVLL